MKDKRISIVIVPDVKKVKRLSIPKWLPKAIIISLVCLISFALLFTNNIYSSYQKLRNEFDKKEKEISNLEKENKNKDEKISNLKSTTKILDEKNTEIENKLSEIDQLQRQLERMTGVKSPSRSKQLHKKTKSKNLSPEDEIEQLKQVLENKEKELETFIVDVENKFEDLEKTPDLNPTEGRLSSPFGYRKSPFGQNMQFHKGVDIANSSGTTIKAAGKGTVIFSGYKNGYGKTVIINHNNSYKTLYAHNRKLLVNTGDNVEKGQSIAEMGSTGRSTGSHLHFEIHKSGKLLDPLSLLK